MKKAAPQAAEIELTAEFQEALKQMESGRENLFITGNAGTGKSTLLRHFRETTLKNTVVLAPTGIAAVNVSGQTIHSFFRFPPKFLEPGDIHRVPRSRKLFESLDTLIIDEVSMVRADVMDAVDYALRLNRFRMEEPFGGVRVVAFGDLHQLAPVVRRDGEDFHQRYASPYFFDARAIREHPFRILELTRIFRQEDEGFIALLNAVRANACTPADLECLNERIVDPGFEHEFDGVVLTATNAGAARINRNKLDAIGREPTLFTAKVTGKFEPAAYPNDETLELKEGAQVMLIKNDPARRWVNGDIGVIESIFDDAIFVNINGLTREVKPVVWEKVTHVLNAGTGAIEAQPLGTFEQFPLRLAWAVTIHKSQGQTFDEVLIDLERGAFAHGQLYVALSRCRTLEGVRLTRPIRPRDVIFDSQVERFIKGSDGRRATSDERRDQGRSNMETRDQQDCRTWHGPSAEHP